MPGVVQIANRNLQFYNEGQVEHPVIIVGTCGETLGKIGTKGLAAAIAWRKQALGSGAVRRLVDPIVSRAAFSASASVVKEFKDQLVSFAMDSRVSPLNRSDVVASLKHLGKDADEDLVRGLTVTVLDPALQPEDFWILRRAIVNTLGTYSQHASLIVPALEKVSETDQNDLIRSAAEQTLTQIK